MAHIERGNQRQYFSNQISGNEVSQGIRQVANTLSNTINQTQDVIYKANESKLANYQIDLSTKWMAKNNEINTKYQADPTNPEREKELAESFENLAGTYEVNKFCQGQWGQIKNNVFNNYKQYNAKWALQQQETNAQNDLKNGYESLINQVSMMGANGANVDEVRLIYNNGIEGLKRGGNAVLGEVVTEQFLHSSNHDIMATYISALATKDPLKAQALMKDEGVINDLGNAETIEKLNQYINSSMANKNKQVAFEELGNTLRAMNSDEANTILDGKADLNQVTKFIQNNKNIPQGSKDLILGIYGIGTKSDYYYDKDKGIITKAPVGGSRRSGSGSGNLVSLKKLSKEQKMQIATDLEVELNNMFYFDEEKDFETVKPKNGNQSLVLGRMQNLAKMQGAIDTAYNAGIITKAQRQSYMNKFIEPMTNYLEANLSELDQRSGLNGIIGNKLGYENIKKAFPIQGTKTEKLAQRKDLLSAQGYYYSALEQARIKYGKNNIYELENLPSAEQQRIYKAASEGAINFAKSHSSHPELFFKNEYPLLYQEGVKMFGFKDGNKVAQQVAKKIYSSPNEKIDVKKTMGEAISDMHALKCNKNLQAKLKLYDEKFTVQKPKLYTSSSARANEIAYKRYNEDLKKYNISIEQRKKALKISDSDLKQTMKESGMNETQVLSLLEMQKKGISLSELYGE